jgi:hypothetical protein
MGVRVRTSFVVVLLVILAVVATYQTQALASRPAAKGSTLKNVGSFRATVYLGPDHGLALAGELRLAWTNTGALTGMLVPKRGAAVPLSGQVDGAAINLIFYLGQGKHIFGVGTIGRDPGAKHGVMGGPLVGPRTGDSGDWAAAITAAERVGPVVDQARQHLRDDVAPRVAGSGE